MTCPHFAFPHDNDPPSGGSKLTTHAAVPSAILGELGQPELAVRRWGSRKAAPSVAVPEAAVNKDRSPSRGKDQVGSTWKILSISLDPESTAAEIGLKLAFRCRPLSPHCPHVPTALLRRKYVHRLSHPHDGLGRRIVRLSRVRCAIPPDTRGAGHSGLRAALWRLSSLRPDRRRCPSAQ